MTWWGRRRTDPPTTKPDTLPVLPDAKGPPTLSNVVDFPDKKLSDANRAAVHALLDKLLDEIGPDEYLVMGIEEPE